MKQEMMGGSVISWAICKSIICMSFQADNHASTSSLQIFYTSDALPDAQPNALKAM